MTSLDSSTARGSAAPWGLRDLLFAILVAFVGIVALNFVALLASRMLSFSLRENGTALAIFVAVQDVIILGAAWLFSVARYRVGWNRLGVRAFDVPFGCGLSAGLLMASYVIRFCYVGAAFARQDDARILREHREQIEFLGA